MKPKLKTLTEMSEDEKLETAMKLSNVIEDAVYDELHETKITTVDVARIIFKAAIEAMPWLGIEFDDAIAVYEEVGKEWRREVQEIDAAQS